MSAALLRLTDLDKRFATGVEALRGVDLEVREGEFLSLLGPSGCGKSTLLRLIAGLSDPSKGAIHWPAGGPRPGRIGYVFQEPTLMPWASVAENVALPLQLAGIARAERDREVAAALDLVGLADFASAHPRELSGGMRMRASLARALVTKPSLLLLDEPFAALDEITRFRLNDDLLTLWERHRWTVVFVSHSVFETVFLSTRLLVMRGRPGSVFAALDIDLPYPRTAELRTSPRYGAVCAQASKLLARAMAE